MKSVEFKDDNTQETTIKVSDIIDKETGYPAIEFDMAEYSDATLSYEEADKLSAWLNIWVIENGSKVK